jgi:hypothetical protein
MITLKKLMTRTISTTASLALLAVAANLSACAERNANSSSEAGESGLSPTSPNFVYGEGWNDLTIEANGATTKVDPLAHISTDHNMCQQPGGAVFMQSELETWNSLASSLNAALKLQPLTTPHCVPSEEDSRFDNRGNSRGVAELTLDRDVKRRLFEYKNVEVCTTIPDPVMAAKIMVVIEQVLRKADRADATNCPNFPYYRP